MASDGNYPPSADDPDASSLTGPYVLRELIRDIPLSADGDSTDGIRITCVDVWNGNLYIGTSAAELLHFVSIPPEPSDDTSSPSYILASRLQPPFATEQEGADKGVKQILVLPDANGGGKACILCNGTLTFYSLPELSPAYSGRIKQSGCTWVGGLDSNEEIVGSVGGSSNGTVAVICLRQRLRLIRIGDEMPRKIRDIELGGVQAIQRRGDLACVADGTSYSLLDVVNQQKVDLFPISTTSSAVPEAPKVEKGLPQLPPSDARSHSRSFSTASPERTGRPHERNVSLGGQPKDNSLLRPEGSSPWPARSTSRQEDKSHSSSPGPPSGREASPAKYDQASTSGSPAAQPPIADTEPRQESPKPVTPLRPNIVSPTGTEFFLTTGTKLDEPGVGMFVNLEGDLVPRGTIEFSSYPLSLVLDGHAQGGSAVPEPGQVNEEAYMLALVQTKKGKVSTPALEIQRWDVDSGENSPIKHTMNLRSNVEAEDGELGLAAGLRTTTTAGELSVPEIASGLRLRRLRRSQATEDKSEAEDKRNKEEDRFAFRFAQTNTSILLYHRDRIHWVARNPIMVQLEQQLAVTTVEAEANKLSIDVPGVQRVVNSIRGQEPRNELEFLTFTYIRQKASLLTFGDLLLQTANGVMAFERNKRAAEEALMLGEIDPRVVLGLVPPLNEEVVEGEHGVWIPQGLCDTVARVRNSFDPAALTQDPQGAYGDNLLRVLKRYLLIWRKKKGFGSVADETQVFQSVDAALLHVLLMLDRSSPRGPATAGSVRAELNEVVDKGLDCFDRAVELFMRYDRLYMLSRLHQSKKNVSMVLATWRRIIEGEKDAGGELLEGEHDLRRYLTKIRDPVLVREYGTWLAQRNPKLGVQIFADDNSRVKFQPSEAVAILKEKAPGAVKDYLEHLVFGKNLEQYAKDLISFYLESVLTVLSTSTQARETLVQSYETYRALRPPKPTYSLFISDNAPFDENAEWWGNRLRLLRLLGGSHGRGTSTASDYDTHVLFEQLGPYSDELVPEMIILNGREGRHQEALRLLTHGLGDYDTAIRYCLLGGSSIFYPSTSSAATSSQQLPSKEEQSRLFTYLLHAFLALPDLHDRLERTSELLDRFAPWFEPTDVLALIPDGWSVELISGFLTHTLQQIVTERRETSIVKTLCSAQNLDRSIGWVEKVEGLGVTIMNSES